MSDPSPTSQTLARATVGSATPYLESARSFHYRWEETHDPALLVLAADSILLYYRWWLWRGVSAVDPVAIDEDNLLTRTRRLAARLSRQDSKAADRLEEIGKEAHRLRGGMYHRDASGPSDALIIHLLACAEEFTALVTQVIDRYTIPTGHEAQLGYLQQQLDRIQGGASLLRGHYPDEMMEGIEASVKAMDNLRPVFSTPGMAEPLTVLLREYENRVDELANRMYRICPKCGGPMEERTWEVGSGGTEDDPAPTNVAVWWGIACKNCSHAVEREIVDNYSP
jgi:hypothetical protein